jgi:penicillin amidase
LADEIIKTNTASPETIAVLKSWDGKMTADSKPALIVNEIRNCIAQKISWDYSLPRQVVLERLSYWVIKEKSARWLPKDFADYPAMMKACDEQVRSALTKSKSYGADEATWRWGKMFEANFFHPLSLVPLIGGQFAAKFTNVNGSGVTPTVGAFVSMRHLASPGTWDATRHVIPLGQSGDPNNPHWKDQFEAWRTGTPLIFPFTKPAVEQTAREIWILEAKK